MLHLHHLELLLAWDLRGGARRYDGGEGLSAGADLGLLGGHRLLVQLLFGWWRGNLFFAFFFFQCGKGEPVPRSGRGMQNRNRALARIPEFFFLVFFGKVSAARCDPPWFGKRDALVFERSGLAAEVVVVKCVRGLVVRQVPADEMGWSD